MSTPPVAPKGPKKVTLLLDRAFDRRVRHALTDDDLTFSALVRDLLERWLVERERPDPEPEPFQFVPEPEPFPCAADEGPGRTSLPTIRPRVTRTVRDILTDFDHDEPRG